MSKINEWLDAPEFSDARFTSVFCNQLDALTLQRVVNPFAVMEEIKILEGRSIHKSRTKAPASFEGGLLHGLKHKHFHTARHLAKNLANYWSRTPDKAVKAIEKVFRQRTSDDLWQLSGAIATRYVDEAYKHKNLARSLTGDWIIYKRHNRRNYYLCLASHDEAEQSVFERFAIGAESEFPELGIRRTIEQHPVSRAVT